MIITPITIAVILLTIFYGCKKIKRKKVLLKQVEEKLTKSTHELDMIKHKINIINISYNIVKIKIAMYFIISLSVSFLTALFCLYMWYI